MSSDTKAKPIRHVGPFRLSRRTFLKGGAAGVTIWLPALEAMLNGNGTAYANGDPLAKRFIEFFWGCSYTTLNGDRTWAPRVGSGPLPDKMNHYFTCDDKYQAKLKGLIARGESGLRMEHLTPSLSDAAIRKYVRIFDAITTKHVVTENNQHWQTLLGVVTMPRNEFKYSTGAGHAPKGPSLDRFIASYARFGGATAPHVHLGVNPVRNYGGISLSGEEHRTSIGWAGMKEGKMAPEAAAEREQAQWDPQAVFEQMFGKISPTSNVSSDAEARRRKSVLDGVLGASGATLARLGARDRQTIEAHLESVRQLERNLAGAKGCTKPAAPQTARTMHNGALTYTQDHSNRTAPRVAKDMRDLAALMISCDYTRTMLFCLYPALGGFDYTSFIDVSMATGPRAVPSVHRDSHDAKPYHRQIVPWAMGQLAALIQQLEAVKEGAGTTLDSTLIWATSENGPQTHSLDNIANVVAGGPKLVKGNFFDTAGGQRPISELHLGILQSLGIPIADYIAWVKPNSAKPIDLLAG